VERFAEGDAEAEDDEDDGKDEGPADEAFTLPAPSARFALEQRRHGL
jgi:hypothetical protein